MKKSLILAMCTMLAYGCSPKADDSQQNMNNKTPTQAAPQNDKTCPPKPSGGGCCEAEKVASEGQTASN